MNDLQNRYNYFWVSEKLYPDWPYKDKRAVITRLDNAWFKNEPVYRFNVKGCVYEIQKEKALAIADRWTFTDKKGKKWQLIPVPEFKLVHFEPTERQRKMVDRAQGLF